MSLGSERRLAHFPISPFLVLRHPLPVLQVRSSLSSNPRKLIRLQVPFVASLHFRSAFLSAPIRVNLTGGFMDVAASVLHIF